jgi:NH3-dependent NAD+ synthetase
MESRLDRERQSQEELLEHIQYNFPDSMLANGYNSAIIGVAGGFDSGRVVYSVKKMVEVCMKELSVDADEAIEWLEYNTFGAFTGEYTPIYVDDYLT